MSNKNTLVSHSKEILTFSHTWLRGGDDKGCKTISDSLMWTHERLCGSDPESFALGFSSN